jgi:hypothetical protein
MIQILVHSDDGCDDGFMVLDVHQPTNVSPASMVGVADADVTLLCYVGFRSLP